MSSNVYKNLIGFGDSLIERLGNVLNVLLIALVCVVIVVVIGRYFFDIGSIALQELTTYLHATIFMLGISYTLKHDGHVRVDIFYRNFSEKKQALINVIGGFMFVFPISIFIGWSSWEYVLASWFIMETSTENNGLPFVYLLKTVMLIMPFLLAIQGLITVAKNLFILYGSPSTSTE
tara:strand:- start:167 stop:697 length:531 start_codon:yes stop_codon:yes gene_type:complete